MTKKQAKIELEKEKNRIHKQIFKIEWCKKNLDNLFKRAEELQSIIEGDI